jgi:hypothetical protein
VQRPLTSGPRGRPTDPALQPLTGWLHRHALQEAVTRNPKLKFGGSQSRWSLGHVARLDDQLLVHYQFNQVGNSSLNAYR